MKRVLLLFLTLLLLIAPAAQAAHEPQSYRFYAELTEDTSLLAGTAEGAEELSLLRAGDTARITSYNTQWALVITGDQQGYVPVSALGEILTLDGNPAPKAAADLNPEAGEPPRFTMDENSFQAKFYASALKDTVAYRQPDSDGPVAFSLGQYKQVDVGEVSNGWCLIKMGERYGYIETKRLFKWDRYDPFAGPIPDLDIWTNILWTNKSVDIISTTSGKVLRTLKPGAAIACWSKDDEGRYVVPIEREYGYVKAEDVAWLMPVVPWEEARSGDLISVMSTFYELGISTLQIRGRCWNLRISGTYISGTVLQPDDIYNENHWIGPYTKSSNYKIAPTTGENGYGGGTCQMNSTLYIATVQLPLDIIHRQVHQNIGMHYCKIGLDASVGGGETNTLIMRNSLPYPIRFHYFVSDGVLTFAIFRD